METYTDQYAPLPMDPRAEAYFSSLPGHIQAQINNRKHRPATYEEMVKAAEEAEHIY